ncbi:MAG: hypothetical protein ABL858_04590 [Candidatus Nitrotoga sp.]
MYIKARYFNLFGRGILRPEPSINLYGFNSPLLGAGCGQAACGFDLAVDTPYLIAGWFIMLSSVSLAAAMNAFALLSSVKRYSPDNPLIAISNWNNTALLAD